MFLSIRDVHFNLAPKDEEEVRFPQLRMTKSTLILNLTTTLSHRIIPNRILRWAMMNHMTRITLRILRGKMMAKRSTLMRKT